MLTENNSEISFLEWKDAARQGSHKNGKQRTQLELTRSILPVKTILQKLIEQLEICRVHQVQYKWVNHARKLDFTMSNNVTQVTATDFGATLNLRASQADNCSVDNHAVICILFVLSDWRVVKYFKEGGEMDETITNDCDKWIFMADTLSKGKKITMLHIMHVWIT